MAEKPSIRGRLNEATHQRYEAMASAKGFDGRNKDQRFIAHLLDLAEQSGRVDQNQPVAVSHDQALNPTQLLETLKLSTHEAALLQEILDSKQLSLLDLIRIGLVGEIRNATAMTQKFEMVDLNDPLARERRKGSGYAYIDAVVRDLMAKNRAATGFEGKVYITESFVAKATGCKRDAIKQYFAQHAEILQQHHQDIGFKTEKEGSSHNLKLAQIERRRKAEKPA